jgi:hypothetical protein
LDYRLAMRDCRLETPANMLVTLESMLEMSGCMQAMSANTLDLSGCTPVK